jgi:hypothetical protein
MCHDGNAEHDETMKPAMLAVRAGQVNLRNRKTSRRISLCVDQSHANPTAIQLPTA